MKYLSVAVILFLLPSLVFAQFQVSFPTTRAVFQRNNANQATFRISGYYPSALTRIEARLIARDGIGASTDWRTIQNNPTGGVFAGDITGQGGWYNLEVRGMNNDQQVGNTSVVERVGVGEVFIVAGQSNAQGVHQDAPNPGNDLVNCVNYRYLDNAYPNDPPTPVFTKLDNTSGFTIAPRGVGSWCWGQLGDLLVKRLNVPVMFFNSAFSGTSSQNWSDSAPEGGIAYGYIFGDPYFPRQPYANLKIALQFYANMLGLRAILWEQGEADNLLNIPTQQYVNSIQAIIAQSRTDYNNNMSWVVARATYGDFIGLTDANIIAAQNLVISSTANTFAGPETDKIQIPRKRPPLEDPEGLHFDNAGLVEVAAAWSASLNDSFFQRSTPVGPAAAPTLSVACSSNNAVNISVNGTYASVVWETGETGNTITKSSGVYRAKVKDARGNTFITGQARVADLPVASVVNNRPPSVCIGSNLSLTANYDNVTWLNQQNNATVGSGRVFTTTAAGNYLVRYQDVSGCTFTSNVVNVTINPLPATPSIANDRPTTFCRGDNTVLRVANDNVQYNWSDGQQGKVVTVGTSGNYFATVTDQNGCTSAQSNTIAVTANPVPAKPVIATSGTTTFCADQNVTLTAPLDSIYQWTTGQTTRSLTTNQAGTFAVRTINQFGCSSVLSDAITTVVNPLPASPTITALGTTTFCAGNQVTLRGASSNTIVWSSGQTSTTISATTSGSYSARSRDQNGCLSPNSSTIVVTVNALPAAPTILSNRGSAICEDDRATLRVEGPYTVFWSTGDSTMSIVVNRAGTYSARVRDINGCTSAQSGLRTLETRALPPAPTVTIASVYTLQAISSSNGNVFRWRRNNDSLAVQTAFIKASQSGQYTAKASAVYSETLTCFSLASTPLTFTVDPNNQGLSIYPNPNPDKIVYLETQESLINGVITVYSLTGQRLAVFPMATFNERKQINLTTLAVGTYILRVQATDFDVSKRILLGL
jgi:hypothetical protein